MVTIKHWTSGEFVRSVHQDGYLQFTLNRAKAMEFETCIAARQFLSTFPHMQASVVVE